MTFTNSELLTEMSKVRSDLRGTLAAREDAVQRRKLDAVTQVMFKLEIAVARERGEA